MKIAFVSQRCGHEVNGGAELVCRELATQLIGQFDIELLTTCALDYVTWEDHYKPGIETLDGVKIQRFPVPKKRNITQFDKLSAKLHPIRKTASLDQQIEWMKQQGPYSPELFSYIEQNSEEYDLFVFFGYLYAQTYFGLANVAEKSILVPFCHDEWMIDFPIFDDLFKNVKGIIYSTTAERDFIQNRFKEHVKEGPVIGSGIDVPLDIEHTRFCKTHNIKPGYSLYLGRIDPSKGCDVLFDYYNRLHHSQNNVPPLIAIGRAVMPLPDEDWLCAPGFVSEQEKWDALAGAGVIILPSEFESLSISVIEGWFCKKPALVNGKCAVLVDQCKRSHGGLWYDNYAEFEACFTGLQSNVGETIGQQGHQFAQTHYTWPIIIKKFSDAFTTT